MPDCIAFGGKGYIAFSVGAGKVVWTMGGVSRRGKLLTTSAMEVVVTYSANELFRGNVCDGVMKVTLVMKGLNIKILENTNLVANNQ